MRASADSTDSFEFPAVDSDLQRQGRNAADNSQQAPEKRNFQESVWPAPGSGENPAEVRYVWRFFCARSR